MSPQELDVVYKTDKGFIAWLMNQETNPDVRNILQEANLSFSDFYKVDTEQDITDETNIEYSGKVVASGPGYVVVEQTSMDTDGKPTKFYQLKTKDNKDVPQEILKVSELPEGGLFTNLEKAIQAQKKLEELVPSDETFEFDGVELSYGNKVQDKKTKEFYIVLSNPNTVKKYNNLLVIKEKDIKKYNVKQAIRKAEKLNPGEFIKRFIEEEINAGSAKLPKNVSKLRVDEATAIIPHQKGRGTNFADDPEIGRRQLDYAIKNLTPEELNQIEVEVTKNEDAGTDFGSFKYQDKAKNPFINRVRAPYNIKLVLPKALADKINAELEKIDLPILDNGTLGYIPNNQVVLFDKDGQTINPLSITADQVSDLFNVYTTKDQAASDIQQNFAVQYTIMNAIAEKMGDADTIKLSLEDIGGVNFLATAGKRDFN